MTKEEFYFNLAFASKGGLFVPSDSHDGVYKNFIEKIKRTDKVTIDFLNKAHPKLPKVNVNYINSLGLTVQAKKKNGKYYIGISLGMYILIYDMFLKMFATKGVLSDIADNSLETEDKKFLSWRIDESIIVDDYAEVSPPKSELRRSLAFQFFVIATRYLLCHEFGHIARGHLDYLAIETGYPEWNETDVIKVEQIDPLESQALEIDADGFATISSFQIAVALSRSWSELSNANKLIYKDQNTFHRFWGFAVCSMLKLSYPMEAFDLELVKLKKHPPPFLRLMMTVAWMELYLNTKGMNEKDRIQNFVSQGLYSAEYAFSKITPQPFNIDLLKKNLVLSEDYVKKVMMKRNDIDPSFTKFSHSVD